MIQTIGGIQEIETNIHKLLTLKFQFVNELLKDDKLDIPEEVDSLYSDLIKKKIEAIPKSFFDVDTKRI